MIVLFKLTSRKYRRRSRNALPHAVQPLRACRRRVALTSATKRCRDAEMVDKIRRLTVQIAPHSGSPAPYFNDGQPPVAATTPGAAMTQRQQHLPRAGRRRRSSRLQLVSIFDENGRKNCGCAARRRQTGSAIRSS